MKLAQDRLRATNGAEGAPLLTRPNGEGIETVVRPLSPNASSLPLPTRPNGEGIETPELVPLLERGELRGLFRRALTEKGLKRTPGCRTDDASPALPTRPNGEGIETTTPSSSPTGASQTLSTRPNQESLQRLCKPRKTPNTRKIGLPMRANGEEIQTEDSHPHSGDPCLLSTGNQH